MTDTISFIVWALFFLYIGYDLCNSFKKSKMSVLEARNEKMKLALHDEYHRGVDDCIKKVNERLEAQKIPISFEYDIERTVN